ncbi:MAG: flagellar hook-associated protein FlgK [Lachnospiraceae bacterium]
MASTFFGLNIGTSGLFAAKTGLNVTAHNVANIETEGYSRQVVSQSAARALPTNNKYGMLGSGVNVNEITQMRSQYYDEKFWSNSALSGKFSTRNYFMTEVQSYLNEVQLEGFTTTFDKMYDGIQELSKDPSNLTIRTQMTNHAQSLCEYFNSLSTNLEKVQLECNYEVKNQVDRINSLSQQIACLTQQINTVEIGGENANDLRDQRAVLVDELSEIVNVSVEEKKIGTNGMTSYVVRLDGRTLVDTYEARQLTVIPRDVKMNQCDADGLYDVYWDNGERLNPESSSLSGTLKALYEVRDGNNEENLKGYAEEVDAGATEVTIRYTNINSIADLNIPGEGRIKIGNGEYTYSSFEVTTDPDTGEYIYTFQLNEEARRAYPEDTPVSVGVSVDYKGIPYYMAQLNEFIRTFAQEFNSVHREGINLNGERDVNFFAAISPLNGEEYNLNRLGKNGENGTDIDGFTSDLTVTQASYYMLTASSFTVSNTILKNPSSVAAASDTVNGIGNADIAKKLLELKSDVSMFKQGDPASYLETLVGEVGVDTKAAENFAKSQENIVKSVSTQRLSVSGVDIDEEAMSLARYQEAYNLSAQVISVMNQIYDKLINEMGV